MVRNTTYWKSRSIPPRRKRVAWPSLSQIGRQAGLVVLVALAWSLLLAGYLRLTGETSSAEQASRADGTVVVESAFAGSPTAHPPTVTPQPATPTSTLAPAVATPFLTASPAAARPEPSPAPSETPTLLPPPTDAAPAAPAGEVSFSADVLPILERRCVKCHGGEKTEKGLVLKSYADLLAGSWDGPVVEPGSAADSYLVEMITTGKMPKNGPHLLPGEIRTISAWIDAGAPDN